MSHYLFETVYWKSYSSAVSGLYTSDCLARLVYYSEFLFKKLDIGWSRIINQDILLHNWNYTSGKLYISLSRITYIGTICNIIGIVYPKDCILADQGLNIAGCFFRNALSLGWAFGCLAFFIFVMPKGAIQKSCATNIIKAIEKLLSLS